jgi:predicted ABC-type ATPase
MPEMWLVAGPNGAGKTTLTREYFFGAIADKAWINPDDTTLLLKTTYKDLAFPPPETANLLGAIISDTRADHMVASAQDFVVETVLSSDKYLKRVHHARSCGFTVTMVYVTLRSPELAVKRVKQRYEYESGGHDVPEQKIRQRWVHSLENFLTISQASDSFTVWDNSADASSGEPPILLMDKENGDVQIHDRNVFAELMLNASLAAQSLGNHAFADKFRNLSKI